MKRMEDLLQGRSRDEVVKMLAIAHWYAKKKAHGSCSVCDVQNVLHSAGYTIGYDYAVAIHETLVDARLFDVRITKHLKRCARMYARNTIAPTLSGMIEALDVGNRTGYSLMLNLEHAKVIRIREDFSFEHRKCMAHFAELVSQMKVVAKKYRGRCEPELLQRRMFVDCVTAIRLAQYGEEFLELTWKR